MPPDLDQRAVDALFDYVDAQLCAGHFGDVDRFVASLKPLDLPTQLLRSVLAITKPAKDNLPSRPAFYAAAFVEMARRRGDEMAVKLLGPCE